MKQQIQFLNKHPISPAPNLGEVGIHIIYMYKKITKIYFKQIIL